MNYYETTVQFETQLDDGKVKKHSKKYWVNAVSVTDAEATVTQYLRGTLDSFEVIAVKHAKVEDYIDASKASKVSSQASAIDEFA